MQFLYIDGINRPIILECVQQLNDAPRGSWIIGQSYSYLKVYNNQCKKLNDEAVKNYQIIPDDMIKKNQVLYSSKMLKL